MQERSRGVTAKDVGRTLAAFARVARARSLYQDNSAALTRMRADLYRGFQEILADRAVLSLRVRPEAFVFEDQVVLQDENPEQSIPFALYRDGVRRLDFSRGLEEQELDTFLSCTARGFHFSGLGDDIVSDLWRHELEHIRYLVVDTAVVDAAAVAAAEAGAPPGAEVSSDVDSQIDGLLRAIYGDSGDDVGPRSIHLDGSDLAAKAIAESLDAVDDLAPGFHPPRTFLDRPAYAVGFEAEVAAETPNRVGARAANASLRALGADVTAADKDALMDGLLRMFDAAIMGRDVPLATRVVAGVRHLDDGSARVAHWLEEAVSETRLRPLVSGLLEGGQDPSAGFQELYLFFRAAGPRAVPIMLGLLPGFGDPRQRRALSELALEQGIERLEVLLDLLNNEQLFVVQEALYILHRLDTPAARALEQRAEDNVRLEVRVAALIAAADHDPVRAVPRAERMLHDPEPKAKVAAAQVLTKLGGKEASRIIETYVERPELDELPTEVKKELFRAYARLCQVRALHLLARYIKRGEGLLAKKDTEEVAVLAMDALMNVRVPRAVELLKKAAVARNKRVREAARARLALLKERP